jgi:hypothetical protein
MLEVVVFTAMVVALPGFVLGFALCRAAAQRDGACEPAAIESLPYDVAAGLARPRRATPRSPRGMTRH